MRNKLDRILKNELCLGCGLCEALGHRDGYKMKLSSNGFYTVSLPKKRNIKTEETICKICPAINVTASSTKSVWGDLKQLNYAWSTNAEIRAKGSSGGVITALAVYLLENKEVDAVLHVGNDKDNFLHNSLKISRTRSDIIENASSRYAPALVFNEIVQILDSTNEVYLFIGKPCDINAIQKIIKKYPIYDGRIKFCLSLVCAGISSYKGTLELLKQESKIDDKPTKIKYRGDGWPGYFTATYDNGYKYQTSYIDSYGRYLRDYTHFRCKICPDGIGLSADIAVGDAWETTNGYPNFTERPGRSFVLVRNAKAKDLLDRAVKSGDISVQNLDINKISQMQPYQYQRRVAVGYRFYLIHFTSLFLFNLKGLNLLHLMLKYPIKKGIREMLGTLKRINNRNKF